MPLPEYSAKHLKRKRCRAANRLRMCASGRASDVDPDQAAAKGFKARKESMPWVWPTDSALHDQIWSEHIKIGTIVLGFKELLLITQMVMRESQKRDWLRAVSWCSVEGYGPLSSVPVPFLRRIQRVVRWKRGEM